MAVGIPLHRDLWQAEAATAAACLENDFVRGLGAGTLPAEDFKAYVAQDAFFLRAFFSAYALAAARSVDRPKVLPRLHALMGGVLDELRLHEGFAAELEIDLDVVEPNGAASAYTDFLLRVAWSGDVAEILAAMTPCMRLYAYLGQQLSSGSHEENPYREWIVTYASPEFEALASELESLLDEVGQPTSAVRVAYHYAMDCELQFFSAFAPR